MKTLSNHTILYDGDCPMCNLYTKAFVKTGMLDNNGRVVYQHLPHSLNCYIDQKRAMDEIALVNSKTGEVNYGIQSLFKIISHAFPIFKPLFRFKPFASLMDKLYKFISYNRRVIIPAKHVNPANDPSFNLGYRLAYIILTVVLTAFVLNNYSSHIDLLPTTNMTRELAICAGQVFWQLGFILVINRSKTWDYLGNLMTISLAGGIALSLVMMLPNWNSSINNWVYGGLFALVVFLMLLEHIRRTSILQLSLILSASWVLYRIIILLIIINL